MEKEIIEIAGFPLIKFQSADKIQRLRDGVLYMKNLEYYRNREKTSGDDTVGDLFEAMLHINEAVITIEETDTIIEIKDKLVPTKVSNSFAFCMFGVNPNAHSFCFSDEQKKEIIDFGDTALLITDKHEFFMRVFTAAEKIGLKGFHGFVNHYDAEVDSANLLASLMNGIENIAFWKREKYYYQQEYRFLIESAPTKDDYFELQIGSIADISREIETSKLLNAMAVKHK